MRKLLSAVALALTAALFSALPVYGDDINITINNQQSPSPPPKPGRP